MTDWTDPDAEGAYVEVDTPAGPRRRRVVSHGEATWTPEDGWTGTGTLSPNARERARAQARRRRLEAGKPPGRIERGFLIALGLVLGVILGLFGLWLLWLQVGLADRLFG